MNLIIVLIYHYTLRVEIHNLCLTQRFALLSLNLLQVNPLYYQYDYELGYQWHQFYLQHLIFGFYFLPSFIPFLISLICSNPSLVKWCLSFIKEATTQKSLKSNSFSFKRIFIEEWNNLALNIRKFCNNKFYSRSIRFRHYFTTIVPPPGGRD